MPTLWVVAYFVINENVIFTIYVPARPCVRIRCATCYDTLATNWNYDYAPPHVIRLRSSLIRYIATDNVIDGTVA